MTALLASIASIPVIGPYLVGILRAAVVGCLAFFAGLYIGWSERGNQDKSAALRTQIETLQENARISARLAELHADREAAALDEITRIKKDTENAISQQAAEPAGARSDGYSGREFERVCDLLGPLGNCGPRRSKAGRNDTKPRPSNARP